MKWNAIRIKIFPSLTLFTTFKKMSTDQEKKTITQNTHHIEIKDEQTEIKQSELKWLGIRHLQITLCFLLISIAYAMRVNLSVAIVAMTDSTTSKNPDVPTYHWGDTSVTLSSFFWGYILLQVFAGRLGELYGPRWLVVVSMLINSIVCFIIPAMADKFGSAGVMACRVIQGLFQGFIYPSAHNMLRKWAPTSERSRMGTFVFSGSSLGTMLAMPITSSISASWLGWPVSFYAFGALGLVFTLFWIWLQSDSPANHASITPSERLYIQTSLNQIVARQIPTPWRAILTSLPFWAIVVANFGQNWGYSTLLTQIPTYVNEILGFDMQQNGFLSAAPYFALWILCFVFGPISDFLINKEVMTRGNVRKLFNTIGTCVPAAALFWLGFSNNSTLSIVLLIVAVGINAAVFCGFQVNHIDLAPNHAGTLMGIANGSSNSFSIVAPLVVQAVVTDKKDKILWRTIFSISSAVYIASAIFFNIFAKGELQQWNDPEEEEHKAK